MRKKILLIGIVLIVLAFVIGTIGASLTNPLSVFTEKNITISAGNYSYMSVNVPAGADFILEAKAALPVNFYVFNSSAFSAWVSNSSSMTSGLSVASALEPYGALLIEPNVSDITFPSSSNVSGSYAAPAEEFLNYSHDYHFVMQNTALVADNATVIYLPPVTKSSLATDSRLRNLVYAYGAISVSVILVLAAGVIVLIYGAIKKSKQPLQPDQPSEGGKDGVDKAYIENLYKNVEKGKRKARRKKDVS